MPVAILSPHLDDAVLSCWHLVEDGDEVTVVNVFTASPPPGPATAWWDRLTGAANSAERMLERRAEDRDALSSTGASATSLDLLDDQYRTAHQPLGVLVSRLLEEVDPEATLYAPAALDGHTDHALVRHAALEPSAAG